MPVDGVNHLEFFSQMEQGSHRAVAVTSDPLGNPLGQPFEKIFSPSQIGQNNRSGVSIDPSGVPNTPVEMFAGWSFLECCHIYAIFMYLIP